MNFFEKHKEIIEKAVEANHKRTFYAQYPEHPKAYGEEAPVEGKKNYDTLLNSKFNRLNQEGETSEVGGEVSPYTGKPLGVKYPAFEPKSLITHAKNAMQSWRRLSPAERAGILTESLERIKGRFFEIAHASMHTSGQSFMMSFQASGPHANDRALEALSLGYHEQSRFPESVDWEKPMGKFSVKLKKNWNAIPRGVSLAIGCSTFPVWNSVPGIFASLVTGNPVIVKPHPAAILPAAIVVAEIQGVLKDAGMDPHTVQLAPDTVEKPITKQLAEHIEVKMIDYTGGSEFGNYIEQLPGKISFTEKAGVNSVIIDSVKDLNETMQNLAFSVSLYSGQMCTAPQNFFIPENGIKDAKGNDISYDQVVEALVKNISGLVNHPKMGAGTLGAIQNEQTLKNAEAVKKSAAKLLLDSIKIENPEFPDARIKSPMVFEVEAGKSDVYMDECFGPVVFVIKTKNTGESIELAGSLTERKGAISCAAYTLDDNIKHKISGYMEERFTPVTFNLTGPIWVNQNAAFSDFHVTGGNAAGNASFTDVSFVAKRFVWVGHKEKAD